MQCTIMVKYCQKFVCLFVFMIIKFAIKVGQSGSGKTSLVELLAILTNHNLQTVYLNSTTDTTELLGSFEQVYLIFFCQEFKIKFELVFALKILVSFLLSLLFMLK